MIRFSLVEIFHQKCLWFMMVHKIQHLEMDYNHFKRVFLKGGGTDSMVSSSRLGSGSLGYLKIAGQHQTRKLEVSGSEVLHRIRLGRNKILIRWFNHIRKKQQRR